MAKLSFGRAVRLALTEALEEDDRVFCYGEDVGYGGAYGATKGLQEKFGANRVRDTPILEAAIAGFAVGAAVAGARPVAEIMHMDFSAIAMDQIANQAAKLRYMFGAQTAVPLVIRMGIGGRMNEGAQHSQSLEAWFTHVPGLKVVTAGCPADVRRILRAAIRDENPVVALEPVSIYEMSDEVPDQTEVPALDYPISRRWVEGSDVTLVTWGPMSPRTLEAAEILGSRGISCEVIDLLTLVPWDEEGVVTSASKTGRIVIVHQANVRGGFGAEVAARVQELAFDSLDAPVQRVGSRNAPIPFSPPLENYVMPDVSRIVDTVTAIQ